MLATLLSLHGVKVTAAATVAEAVEKIQTVKPDLVITLTGHVGQADRLKVLSAGYQIHLAKPIEPEELLVVIANLAGWNGK
jgi:CheY-like chemotaxis protein